MTKFLKGDAPEGFVTNHAGNPLLAHFATCLLSQQEAGFGDTVDARQVDCPTCGAPGFNSGWGYWSFACGGQMLTSEDAAATCEGPPWKRQVIDEIATERRRQIVVEGYGPEHDDRHVDGDLARAAACYALHASREVPAEPHPRHFPLDWEWKQKGRRRDLVRAAALIAAEIDRLDRMAQP